MDQTSKEDCARMDRLKRFVSTTRVKTANVVWVSSLKGKLKKENRRTDLTEDAGDAFVAFKCVSMQLISTENFTVVESALEHRCELC